MPFVYPMTQFVYPNPFGGIPSSPSSSTKLALSLSSFHQQLDVHLWGRWKKGRKNTGTHAQALSPYQHHNTHKKQRHKKHTESHLRFWSLCSLTVTPTYRPIMQKCWLIHGFHAKLDAQRKLKLAGARPGPLLLCVCVCVWSVLRCCAHRTFLSRALHHFVITGQTITHAHTQNILFVLT